MKKLKFRAVIHLFGHTFNKHLCNVFRPCSTVLTPLMSRWIKSCPYSWLTQITCTVSGRAGILIADIVLLYQAWAAWDICPFTVSSTVCHSQSSWFPALERLNSTFVQHALRVAKPWNSTEGVDGKRGRRPLEAVSQPAKQKPGSQTGKFKDEVLWFEYEYATGP